MQIINGNYNDAYVMIDVIDDTTKAQIQGFVNDPSFEGSHIAIMPDCHAGAGSCIGFTMQMKDRIIPDVVGVDIGCGMLCAKYDIEDIDLKAFDAFVRNNIPSGFNLRDKPLYHGDTFSSTANRVGAGTSKVLHALGTLGGGNHFIEVGRGSDNKIYVTIHSGSRNFGLKIAKYHGDAAKKLCRNRPNFTGIPYLEVDSPEGRAYIEDQEIGVAYANINRMFMMDIIDAFFGWEYRGTTIESVHNFIDSQGMIRKGATPAHLGQDVILPFNMRDGLAICRGLGDAFYNFSAPHGAGRILSRTKAKAVLDVGAFKKEMEDAGVYTTTASAGTLDEAPGAYKDKDLILENIKDTVEVVEMVKPIYNFKAGGE